jgi:beta-lactam-binding protein with PASTA domain
VVLEDTDDPTFDGLVISQDPVGGTQAKPNTLVTLFVGRYVELTTTNSPTTP